MFSRSIILVCCLLCVLLAPDPITAQDDGPRIIQLAHNEDPDAGGYWSPDGMRIVFASDRDGDYESYSMELA